jgi:hypothetical protein
VGNSPRNFSNKLSQNAARRQVQQPSNKYPKQTIPEKVQIQYINNEKISRLSESGIDIDESRRFTTSKLSQSQVIEPMLSPKSLTINAKTKLQQARLNQNLMNNVGSILTPRLASYQTPQKAKIARTLFLES